MVGAELPHAEVPNRRRVLCAPVKAARLGQPTHLAGVGGWSGDRAQPSPPVVAAAIWEEEDERQGDHDVPAAVHVLVVACRLDQGEDQDGGHSTENSEREPDCARSVGFQDLLPFVRSDD